MSLAPIREVLAEYLKHFHQGEENAIHSRDLEKLFDLDRRSLQRNISRLRQDAVPICSSGAGYFYAQTQAEINDTLRRLRTNMPSARDGLAHASLLYQEPLHIIVHITV